MQWSDESFLLLLIAVAKKYNKCIYITESVFLKYIVLHVQCEPNLRFDSEFFSCI